MESALAAVTRGKQKFIKTRVNRTCNFSSNIDMVVKMGFCKLSNLISLLLAMVVHGKHRQTHDDCRQTGFALETMIPQRTPMMSEGDCADLCSLRHTDLVIWLNHPDLDLVGQNPTEWQGGRHTWTECKAESGVCKLDSIAELEDHEKRPGVKQCRCTAIIEFPRWGPHGDEESEWCYPHNAQDNLALNAVVRGIYTDFDTSWRSVDLGGRSWHLFKNEHVRCYNKLGGKSDRFLSFADKSACSHNGESWQTANGDGAPDDPFNNFLQYLLSGGWRMVSQGFRTNPNLGWENHWITNP